MKTWEYWANAILSQPPEVEVRAMYNDVLLIDDEATFRGVIARNLRGRGLTVREAETVQDAIAEIEAAVPDVLLLDLNLPDRTGWDVLRELKQRGKHVPTIIVSAIRVPAAKLEEFQPMAYLPKPFPLEALLRLVIGPESGANGSDEETTPAWQSPTQSER